MAELFKGQAGSPITYLISDISANQTTIAIADDTALPDAPNICTIGYGEEIETIRYGIKNNGVLQGVTRGIEGTPRAWQAGAEVARFFTAYDHNEIIETLSTHLADFATVINTAVFGINGWFKDKKTGLIIQWGEVEIQTPQPNTGYTTTVTLPIAFPNQKLHMMASVASSRPDTRFAGTTFGTGLDSFQVHAAVNTSAAASVNVKWIAIGR